MLSTDEWRIIISYAADVFEALRWRILCRESLTAFEGTPLKLPWYTAPVVLPALWRISPLMDHVVVGSRFGNLSLDDLTFWIAPCGDYALVLKHDLCKYADGRSILACAIHACEISIGARFHAAVFAIGMQTRDTVDAFVLAHP